MPRLPKAMIAQSLRPSYNRRNINGCSRNHLHAAPVRGSDCVPSGGGVEMPKQCFKENACGEQWTGLELPDIVHMRLQGKVTLEECRMLNEAHLGYGKEVPYFFYLIDLTELEDLPPAVRKEASETVKLLPLRGT